MSQQDSQPEAYYQGYGYYPAMYGQYQELGGLSWGPWVVLGPAWHASFAAEQSKLQSTLSSSQDNGIACFSGVWTWKESVEDIYAQPAQPVRSGLVLKSAINLGAVLRASTFRASELEKFSGWVWGTYRRA